VSYEENFRILLRASELLEEFADDIVYVGGITTFLYIDVNIADELRPTRAVDFIVPARKPKDYDAFQEKLRQKGFTHDQSPKAPLCRFLYKDELVVDAMPVDPSILGFTNSWYREGMLHRQRVSLGDREISVFTLPYFIASKFEAYRSRGATDPRLSHDLEDIIMILDGSPDLQPTKGTERLSEFLDGMKLELQSQALQEALSGFLQNDGARLARVNRKIESF
jgi:hypothetical protein